jgi:hypothetical protein
MLCENFNTELINKLCEMLLLLHKQSIHVKVLNIEGITYSWKSIYPIDTAIVNVKKTSRFKLTHHICETILKLKRTVKFSNQVNQETKVIKGIHIPKLC